MKVLIITASINPKSGWGRHALAIKEHLEDKGVQVNLYVARLGLMSLVRNSVGARRAARGCDVVHSMDVWPLGLYDYCAVLGRNIPLFINGVGTYSVAPLYSWWKGWLLKRVYAKAKKVFCISQYTKQQLLNAGVRSSTLEVVHFGVPALPVLSLAEQEAYKKEYDISPDAYPIILTVGAIKDRKGQLETLKAVELLKKKYPQIVYVMAGFGNQASYVAQVEKYTAAHNLQKNIRILNGVDDRALAALYAMCTVFALNSNTDEVNHHFEGFGAVILEACQFGKPAVGSNNSGIEDAIDDGASGLLTKQRDPADIAEKIQKILDNLSFYSGNASLQYTKFDWDKTTSAYLAAYKEVS